MRILDDIGDRHFEGLGTRISENILYFTSLVLKFLYEST